MILTRSPYRITLGGGGTDRPDFYTKHGGFVVSMAIDKYIYLGLKPDPLEKKIKVRYLDTEIVNTLDELKHDRAREALRLHDLNHSIEVNSCGDVPGKTGLGSSGSYLVALLNAIRHHKKEYCTKAELAEEACNIEMNTLRLPVGKQDQYMAAFGGLKILDIKTSGSVEVSPPEIKKEALSALTNNLQVYFLKKKRNASDVLSQQNCSRKGNEERLLKIKEMGYRTLEMLEGGNFDEYGLMLDEYWSLKKQFSPDISFGLADQLYSELKERFNILGGKILGAGGGGFLMIYTPKNHAEIEKFMLDNSIIRLRYKPDHEGSKILL